MRKSLWHCKLTIQMVSSVNTWFSEHSFSKFITVIIRLNSLKKLRWHCVYVRASLKTQGNLFKLIIVISSNRVSNQATTLWSTAEVFKNSKVFRTHTNFTEVEKKNQNHHILGLQSLPCHLRNVLTRQAISSCFSMCLFSFRGEEFEIQRDTRPEKTLFSTHLAYTIEMTRE